MEGGESIQTIILAFILTEIREQVSDLACTVGQRIVIMTTHVAARKLPIPILRKKELQASTPPKVLSKIELLAKEGEEAVEAYLSNVHTDQFIEDLKELVELSQKAVLKQKVIDFIKDIE